MMKLAILLPAVLLLQDEKKDLKTVNENMGKVANYHFTAKIVVNNEAKLSLEGEYFAPDAIHLRSDKGELARKGDKTLVKAEGEDWKEPDKPADGEKKPGVKSELTGITSPHELVKKIADQCPVIKKERTGYIGGKTVDIYVWALGAARAKELLAGTLHPLWVSWVEWTKSKNAILFYVGREDLYYKMEIKFDSEGAGGKTGSVTIEFFNFNSAKCRLSKDVKKRLGWE